jgi:hypothetical protein
MIDDYTVLLFEINPSITLCNRDQQQFLLFRTSCETIPKQ